MCPTGSSNYTFLIACNVLSKVTDNILQTLKLQKSLLIKDKWSRLSTNKINGDNQSFIF